VLQTFDIPVFLLAALKAIFEPFKWSSNPFRDGSDVQFLNCCFNRAKITSGGAVKIFADGRHWRPCRPFYERIYKIL